MNKPVVYLQGPNGEEYTLPVTSPDPDDGTYCAHMPKSEVELAEEWWVRIVPDVTWKLVGHEVDNRDSRTTWLWIGGYGNQYIEIDPVDMIENMIENIQGYIEDPETETEVTMAELNAALQILQRV